MKAKITTKLVEKMGVGQTIYDLGVTGFQARRQLKGVSFSLIKDRKRITIGRFGTMSVDAARMEALRVSQLAVPTPVEAPLTVCDLVQQYRGTLASVGES